jgi:hypothetical protein
MPEQRGRKRVRDRRRERRERVSVMPSADTIDTPAVEPRPVRRATPAPTGMPSPTARATGFMIAIITALIAAVMIYNAATGDSSGGEATARILIGAGLLLLSTFVGLLVLAPSIVVSWVRRGKP